MSSRAEERGGGGERREEEWRKVRQGEVRREGLILNGSQLPSLDHICLTDMFRSKSGTRHYIEFRRLVSVSGFCITRKKKLSDSKQSPMT